MICGQCNEQFKTEEAYLLHECPVTGVAPTEPETMGKDHARLAEAALKRGEEQEPSK